MKRIQIGFSLIVFLLANGVHAGSVRSTAGITANMNSVRIHEQRTNKSPSHTIALPKDYYSLTEDFPEPKLTSMAMDALNRSPSWLQEDLRDNLEAITPEYQDLYANMILNPAQERFTDEIAFCVAQIAPEILMDPDFIPGIIEENVFYVYEHDSYLDYVRLVDTGAPGLDPDYFTTAYYRVKEADVVTEYEMDKYYYYWFIVHPKIEDEPLYYIVPGEVGDQTAPPPDGVFWRDWLFNYTEPKPGTIEDYPILRDQMSGVTTLWNSNVNSLDNGAVGVITQWITSVLSFDSGTERPRQPVRIYKLHMGRCGEHQDITSAAARACLIPCLNSQAYNQDHVWNEFWDRRFIHWEPVNTSMDDPMQYENGWGKVFTGVVDVAGDGYVWDVIDRYSEGTATVRVTVKDANNNPVDGAKVLIRANFGYPGTWGFTNADGFMEVKVGDGIICQGSIRTEAGKFPESGYYGIAPMTENGGIYYWEAVLPEELPPLKATEAQVTETLIDYRFVVDYSVEGEVQTGHYQYDKLNTYTRRVGSGNIDSFIVDQNNLSRYMQQQPFDAYEFRPFSDSGSYLFQFPENCADDTWSVIFTAERKQHCQELLNANVILQQFDGSDWVDSQTVAKNIKLFPGEKYVVSVAFPAVGPTCTPTPIPTDTPTATPMLTATPTINLTATPTFSPTPQTTPTAPTTDMTVQLKMPLDYYAPGDLFWVSIQIFNPFEDASDAPVFVILDVYGELFFWPTWVALPEVAWETMTIPHGESTQPIIESFEWPETGTEADDIFFYAAITDAAVTKIIGQMDTKKFAWGNARK